MSGQRKENQDELKGQASEREYESQRKVEGAGGKVRPWESEWERQKES